MQSMTIGKKLFGVFGIMILLLSAMGVASVYLLRSLGESSETLGVTSAGKLYQAGLINGSSSETMISVSRLLNQVQGGDVSAADKDIAHYDENDSATRQSMTKMRALKPLPKNIVSLDELQTELEQAAPIYKRFVAAVRVSDAKQAAEIYKTELWPVLLKIDDHSLSLMDITTERMAAVNKSAEEQVTAGDWLVGILILFAAAVAVLVVFIVRRINADLRGTANELKEGASQIAAAAGEVSSSSQSLAQGASEQAASIEETSAATEEINSMARRNTENSGTTATMVSEAASRFLATNESLNEMVIAMAGINTASEQISRIIKVIDQIAFQTNILALNAAVEAARAGDAGMGFAVVADEVRNLAQRSAQAAKDTATLIEDSIAKSQAGKLKVDHVAAEIRAITAESTKMKLLVDEINLGSQEQSKGIDQVSRSIHEMEKVTQSNAASAEQSAAAAEELTAQSQSVRDIVNHLTSLVG